MSIKYIGPDKPVILPSAVYEIQCPHCSKKSPIRISLMGIQLHVELGTLRGEHALTDLKTQGKQPAFSGRQVA